MDLPDIYLEQLKKISIQFEKEKQEEDDGVSSNSRLGRRILRIRRDYSQISHWSRFGSLPKKNQIKFNPELTSENRPMTARMKGVEIEQMSTLPVSSRRKSIIEGLYDR